MKLSTHYYVLSLSERSSRLYECFRDNLIDIQNSGFPFKSIVYPDGPNRPGVKETCLRDFIRKTDQHFDSYYKQDPLTLVVIGEKELLRIFRAVTTHPEPIIGFIEGYYSDTSLHDLGKIVWAVDKAAMGGTEKMAIHELEKEVGRRKNALGIEAVARAADSEVGATLFVEEDYHVKSTIRKTDRSVYISKHVDINDVIDDAVDVVIERVLANDGNVFFLDSGSLIKFQRIALIAPEQDLGDS